MSAAAGAAAAAAAASVDPPASVAASGALPPQHQPPTSGAGPQPPPSLSDAASPPSSQAQVSSPSPSRGGSAAGRSGGRGRGGGPHSSGSSPGGRHHHPQGPRGGDGAVAGGGGRHPSGGRNLYNPQGRAAGGGGPHQHHHHHPQPVQVHQASGLPHGHVPAYLPGSASLVEELDSRLMVVMRDGRNLIGTLISYDQFSNLVLDDTVERRHVVIPRDPSLNGPPSTSSLYYSDVPLGLYVVRGDSVVVMGRTNPAASTAVGQAVSLQELEEIQRKQPAAGELDWDVDTDLVA